MIIKIDDLAILNGSNTNLSQITYNIMHYACKGQHGTTMCRLAMKETLTKIREFLKYKVKIDCNNVLS